MPTLRSTDRNIFLLASLDTGSILKIAEGETPSPTASVYPPELYKPFRKKGCTGLTSILPVFPAQFWQERGHGGASPSAARQLAHQDVNKVGIRCRSSAGRAAHS